MRVPVLARALACALLTHSAAHAAEAPRTAHVLPSLSPLGDQGAEPRRPLPTTKDLYLRAQELDTTLRGAIDDLGLTREVAGSINVDHVRDLDLLNAAKPTKQFPDGRWIISPRLESDGENTFLIRIVTVPPGGKELRVRAARCAGEEVAVQGLILMRDTMKSSSVATLVEKTREPQVGIESASAPWSPGREVLATQSAIFGGFAAFAMQRASGSDDPRVLLPLVAIGSGVGIGASLLAAAEWNVTTGNAWYVTAGTFWGSFAGIAIANGTSVNQFTDRYAYGVMGGFSGLGLATVALVKHKMDEGDALLAHSGGALGSVVGGISQMIARGAFERTPQLGGGIGAAAGTIAMGALATRVRIPTRRVLLLDLGIGLGGVTGAAVASPLVFETVTVPRTRAFMLSTLTGAAIGGVLTWYATRNDYGDKKHQHTQVMPSLGVSTVGLEGAPQWNYGAGLSGAF